MKQTHCVNCGLATRRLSRGRCLACYVYLARRGRERPLVPRGSTTCACGYAGPIPHRGRCPACYLRPEA